MVEVPPEEQEGQSVQEIREAHGAACSLPCTKATDMQYFVWLLEDTEGEVAPLLTKEEAKGC